MYSRNVLFSLHRGDFEEISVQGEITVVDGTKTLFETSEVTGLFPARSLLKPFQFLTTGLASKTWTEHDVKRLTASVGSISATKDQVAQLKEWYNTPELKSLIPKLLLPPSFPMDEKERVRAKENSGPERIYHTCFSKHMAILQGCSANGWPLEDYLSIYHPFHGRLMGTLGALLKTELKHTPSVTDGCLLPSPVLSMQQMAELYRKMASAPETNALGKIKALMLTAPEWVGGPKRIDTLLMQKNSGRVIAKEGADGLLGIGVVPNPKFPDGLGIIIKLMLGYHPAYSAIALAPLLQELGLESVHEAPKGHEVKYHYRPFGGLRTDTMDISPRVGPGTAIWPGDIGFKNHRSLDTGKGAHLTLSSIETTVHIGAHTDAPNHFEICKTGIDEVALEKYLGPCQIIPITKPQSTTILPQDIENTPILAKRVIFKTDSFPNPSHFNTDFVALSAELIEYLATKGVVLVAIDTPSIDLFHSKDLKAHHATTVAGMGILEGINLDGIDAGVYELIALPLKLEGCDASPVRAVLRKI